MKRLPTAGATALALALSFAAAPAIAQTHSDAYGTIVPAVVPLAGCLAIGGCVGPNSSSNAFYDNFVPTSSSSLAVSHAVVSSLGSALVVKASASNLYGFNCTAVNGGAAGYCVAVNASSAPSAATITGVLDACYLAVGAAGCSLERVNFPVAYSTGIVILVTSASNPFTYTTGTDTAFISADFD